MRKRGAEDFRALIQNYDLLKENIHITDEHLETMDYLRRWEKISETKYAKLRTKKDFSYCLNIMENTTNKTGGKEIDIQKMIVGHPDNRLSRLLCSKGNSLELVKPIILVPEEVISGNLNLENMHDFIKKGEYKSVTSIDKSKKRFQEIYLTILDKNITFEIHSDIGYLKSKKKLNQVVAIFIKGTPFQFRDCQGIWGVDTIAKLFKKVRGYYLHYNNTQINQEIKNWNIKLLKLDRNDRHKDMPVSDDFFDDFKKFLLSVPN